MFIAEFSLCFWNGYFHSAACEASAPPLIIPQVRQHCQKPYVPLPFQPGWKAEWKGKRREGGLVAGGGG